MLHEITAHDPVFTLSRYTVYWVVKIWKGTKKQTKNVTNKDEKKTDTLLNQTEGEKERQEEMRQ